MRKINKWLMVCVCALFSLTGCYNTEPRENVLKYIIGPTTLMRMCWRNFPGGTKNRRGRYTDCLSDF